MEKKKEKEKEKEEDEEEEKEKGTRSQTRFGITRETGRTPFRYDRKTQGREIVGGKTGSLVKAREERKGSWNTECAENIVDNGKTERARARKQTGRPPEKE